MTVSIAINGFGRIGRMVFRQAMMRGDVNIVAVNASYPSETLAHLIKYDTNHGMFPGTVEAVEGALIVNGKRVELVSERDPLKLPWAQMGVDIVIEATGKFNEREKAAKHIEVARKSYFNCSW